MYFFKVIIFSFNINIFISLSEIQKRIINLYLYFFNYFYLFWKQAKSNILALGEDTICSACRLGYAITRSNWTWATQPTLSSILLIKREWGHVPYSSWHVPYNSWLKSSVNRRKKMSSPYDSSRGISYLSHFLANESL